MTSTEPSLLLAVGSLILGLAASLIYAITGHLITLTHEGSHALFGSATGWTVSHVMVNARQEGATQFTTDTGFLPTLFGYAGPSIFGIAGATLLVNGVSPEAVLWISVVCLVLLFIQMRTSNIFGLFIAAFWATIFFVIVREGSPGIRALAAYTWIWFLLLGGVVHTFRRNAGGRRSLDSDILRDLTMVPSGFWCSLWCLVTLAALVYGGGILFGLIDPVLQRAPG